MEPEKEVCFDSRAIYPTHSYSNPVQIEVPQIPVVDLEKSPSAAAMDLDAETEELMDVEHATIQSPPAAHMEKEEESDKEDDEARKQRKEAMLKVWKRNMINTKHKAAPQVHAHTKSKAPTLGTQFAEMLEQASGLSMATFQQPNALADALTDAMKGLAKMAAITILKNATDQAAESTNNAAVIELLMQKQTTDKQVQELEASKAKLASEVTEFTSQVDLLRQQTMKAEESTQQHKEALDKELSLHKVKADDLIAVQVKLADVTNERNDLQTKAKNITDELNNVRNDLWNTDELLRLTRNQLEVSEQSLKVALERGAQRTKTTSMASATTATSKDDSAQELSQAKNVIDAQRLENFSLTQELMSLKAELAEVKAKVATIPVISSHLRLQVNNKDH